MAEKPFKHMAKATESDAKANPLEEYRYAYQRENIQTETVSDTVAKVREKIAPFRFKLAARQISKELQLSTGEKVLELGSGLGLLGKAVRDEIDGEVNYFGIELAYQSAKASDKQGLLESQANVLDLPFPDNTFGAIVTTDVLEHIKDSDRVVSEMSRVLKPGGKAFIVIADPSEARFHKIHDHIDRTKNESDVKYWENIFKNKNLKVLSEDSEKYRKRDWRKIFNLPFLIKLKDKPGFACAFNPVNRPGAYIVEKPASSSR